MAIKKYCSYTGCRVLLDEGVTYCTGHQKQVNAYKAARDREYRHHRDDKKEQDFYRSKQWRQARDASIAHHCGLDIFEYYKTGLIVEADTVHHIMPLKEEWSKRINQHNLIPLTDQNHKLIHDEYTFRKKEIQEELFEMKLQFYKDFKE